MVTDKDVIEAFNKGKKSGAASARKKDKDAKTPKKRPKVWRMKKPIVQVKQAIGKFQHKHPYQAAIVEGVLALPVVDRALYYTTGQSLGQTTGKNFGKVPGFYPLRNLVGGLADRIIGVFR